MDFIFFKLLFFKNDNKTNNILSGRISTSSRASGETLFFFFWGGGEFCLFTQPLIISPTCFRSRPSFSICSLQYYWLLSFLTLPLVIQMSAIFVPLFFFCFPTFCNLTVSTGISAIKKKHESHVFLNNQSVNHSK